MIALMRRRRLMGILSLLGFCAAATGFPVPNPPQKADEDFPCRWHTCGCLNAEMCRLHCCCHKPTPVKTCCAKKADKACHQDEDQQKAPKSVPSKGRPIGPMFSALTCQGLTMHWVSLTLPVSGEFLLALQRPTPTCDRSPLPIVQLLALSSLEPDAPPPRA